VTLRRMFLGRAGNALPVRAAALGARHSWGRRYRTRTVFIGGRGVSV
jgi:hypothetical protein